MSLHRGAVAFRRKPFQVMMFSVDRALRGLFGANDPARFSPIEQERPAPTDAHQTARPGDAANVAHHQQQLAPVPKRMIIADVRPAGPADLSSELINEMPIPLRVRHEARRPSGALRAWNLFRFLWPAPLVIVGLLLLRSYAAVDGDRADAPAPQRTLSAVSLCPISHHGPVVTSADLRGSVCLMLLWRPESDSVLQGISLLAEAERRHGGRTSLRTLCVAISNDGSPGGVGAAGYESALLLRQLQLERIGFVDHNGITGRAAAEATTNASTPLLLLIDARGQLLDYWTGPPAVWGDRPLARLSAALSAY